MNVKKENGWNHGTGCNSTLKAMKGNRFGVKEKNNPGRMRFFADMDNAIVFAVMNYQKEITWLNTNVILSVSEIMVATLASNNTGAN